MLTEFVDRHRDAKQAVDAWYGLARNADWKTPQDIKRQFRSADFLADNRVIFNIKGNHHRLVVKVRYQQGVVLVEWIGTHADYSKQRF